MPQKTKKEKIIAEYRRRLQMLKEHRDIHQKLEPVSAPTHLQSPPKIIAPEDDSLTVSYFKSDFTKSLFLIAAVIALEISLYFVRIIK